MVKAKGNQWTEGNHPQSSPFRHLAQQTHVTESLLLVLSSQQPLLYTAATSNLLLDLQNQLTLLSFFSLSPSRNQCPSFLCFYWPQNVFVLYIPFSANSKNWSMLMYSYGVMGNGPKCQPAQGTTSSKGDHLNYALLQKIMGKVGISVTAKTIWKAIWETDVLSGRLHIFAVVLIYL